MMRFFTYIVMLIVVFSCTVWEKSTVADIARPGAALRVDSARLLNLYVFDMRDTLVFARQFDSTQLIDSLDILDGVPEGRYRVVNFLDCSRYRFSQMELGVSSFADLECEMVDFVDSVGNPIATSDSIRYGSEFVDCQWGERIPVSIPMRDLYYQIGVRITFADGYEFDDQINLPSMEFRRLPRRFDNRGISSDPSVVFMISQFITDDVDRVAARLRVPRFTDDNRVELHVVTRGYSLGSVVLSPSKFGVSPDAQDHVSFIVDVDIQPRQIIISVDDWVVGTIQTTEIL